MNSKAELIRSEGYRLCKLMGNKRCGCEERQSNPCEELMKFLYVGGGDADRAFEKYEIHQSLLNFQNFGPKKT